jgi:tRNA pseudouridine55 synthase
VGGFGEDCATSLESIEDAAAQATLADLLRPIETALCDLPSLALSAADAARLRQGQAVLLRGRDAPIFEGPVYATSRGKLVALGEMKQGELRPRRIFNLPR